MLAFVRHTPMRAVPKRLNELGSFPMALLVGGALVFDLHTHLRPPPSPSPTGGTQRSSWRDADVETTGNTDLACRTSSTPSNVI